MIRLPENGRPGGSKEGRKERRAGRGGRGRGLTDRQTNWLVGMHAWALQQQGSSTSSYLGSFSIRLGVVITVNSGRCTASSRSRLS